MFVFTQQLGEPIIIGDAVVYINDKSGGKVRVAIDAPAHVEILRDDLVYKNLTDARFYWVKGDCWRRDGKEYTTREAIITWRRSNT